MTLPIRGSWGVFMNLSRGVFYFSPGPGGSAHVGPKNLLEIINFTDGGGGGSPITPLKTPLIGLLQIKE